MIYGGGTLYELFVLGELGDQPMHGYLLHAILVRVLGRSVSWASLYPVLRALELAGHIEASTTDLLRSGRAKKIYRLTPAGRARFVDLMQEPFERSPDFDDIFRIKLSKVHLVDQPLQRTILLRHRDRLSEDIRQVLDLRLHIMAEPGITAAERPDILAAMAYDEHVLRAKQSWVQSYLDQHNEREGNR